MRLPAGCFAELIERGAIAALEHELDLSSLGLGFGRLDQNLIFSSLRGLGPSSHLAWALGGRLELFGFGHGQFPLAEQRSLLLPPPKALPVVLVRAAADQLSRDLLAAAMLGVRTKSNGFWAVVVGADDTSLDVICTH